MQRKLGRKNSRLGVRGLALLAAGPAAAQADAAFAKAIADYPDLEFASTHADPGQAGSKGNSLYKPQGAGPFPPWCWRIPVADCSRIWASGPGSWWRRVLSCCCWILRSQAAHGVLPAARVRTPRVYKDAFDGMRHLASLRRSIRRASIWSACRWAVSPPASRPVRKSPRRSAASAASGRRSVVRQLRVCAQERAHAATAPPRYGPPRIAAAGQGRQGNAHRTPLSPVDDMKAQGRPVSWHVYEQTTHGWDKSNRSAATCSTRMPPSMRWPGRWSSCVATEKRRTPCRREWCPRPESNRYGLAAEGISYHFGCRRRVTRRSWSGARLRHSLAALGARRSLFPPLRAGLASVSARNGSRAFAEFDGLHLRGFPEGSNCLKSLVSTNFTTRARPA